MRIQFRGENILNVPNAISLYRLLMFPVILTIGILGYERGFVILFCINLLTDIVDGFIARNFHMQTNFGATLDNLADIGTYILAIFGLFAFKWAEVKPYSWLLFLFLSLFVLSYGVAFLRFGKVPGLHLYSAVIAGYLQGAFFFALFAFGFWLWFYYLAVGWGVIAYTEKIILLLRIPGIKSGLKGLYWYEKSRRENPS